MKAPTGWVIAIVLLWLACACQLSVAYQITIAGSLPDFLLTSVCILAIFADRRSGAIVGFIGGLLHGAIAGGHMAAYVVTRTLVGFFIGWLTSLELEANAAYAFVVSAAATVFVQFVFLIMSPRGAVLPLLLATIGSAMYNGVLAIPLYVLLKKVLNPPRR